MNTFDDLQREKQAAAAEQRRLDERIQLINTFITIFRRHSSSDIREAATAALHKLRQEHDGSALGTYFDQLHAFYDGARDNPDVLHRHMVQMLRDLELPR